MFRPKKSGLVDAWVWTQASDGGAWPDPAPGQSLWVQIVCDGSQIVVKGQNKATGTGEPSESSWSGVGVAFRTSGFDFRGGSIGRVVAHVGGLGEAVAAVAVMIDSTIRSRGHTRRVGRRCGRRLRRLRSSRRCRAGSSCWRTGSLMAAAVAVQ